MGLTIVHLEGKSLVPLDTHDILRTEGEEQDVPEEMEGILEDLFQAIQDKVLGFRPHLLERTHSDQSSRILLFAGRQRRVLAGFPKGFPRTSLDKCWRLS
jgi:hypothetical protein